MKKSNKRRIVCLAALMLLFSAVLTASAAEDAAIIERYTTQDGILLYVKGVEGTAWEAAYQAGTNSCTVEGINTVREQGETIYTLILWDNSLSVMNRQGDTIRDILLDIMANRASQEKFAIALINNETTYLTEYTDDYAVLKQAVEAVEGQNQDAYIIENLYHAILDLNQISDTGYKRILLISDGMDAVEIGYSKAELDALIAESPYPIYTIGTLDDDHTQELQNLFALSRMTGAEYFYMDELEDISAVAQTMSEELNILRISVLVPEEMRDGSVQNSQLILKSGADSYTLQCQVTLPFAETGLNAGEGQNGSDGQEEAEEDAQQEEALAGEDGDAAAQAETEPSEEEAVETQAAGESGSPLLLIGCVAGAAVLLVVIIIVIVSSKKKKTQENAGDHYAQLDQRLKNERYKAADEGNTVSPVQTEIGVAGEPANLKMGMRGAHAGIGAGEFEENGQSGRTRLLFDEPSYAAGEAGFGTAGRRIVLTDMENPVKTYGCGISDRVVIGRNAARCNLAIATDNAVSERHCEIECRGEQFYLRDLGSSNGTYVNGMRINAAIEVQTGFMIKIGRTQYRLTIE